MIKVQSLFFVLLYTVSCQLSGQETNYGPGYQTILVNNPAFTGSSGTGTMRLSYLNFYPGKSYNLHSVYFSYDSYFPAIHGGAGFFVSDDYQGGILNDLRGGLSYSYFLQAGKELYINAGLSAGFLNRGFNFRNAVLPEQIDQMGGVSIIPSEILSNRNRMVLDVGTGILFIYKRFFGGLGVTHLTQPDLSGYASSSDMMKMKYFINTAFDFDLDERKNLKVKPLLAVELQGDYFMTCFGGILESNYLSVNSLLFSDNNRNIDLQAGFSLRYERMELFYNYKFNLKSGSSLLPFSLIHQMGLTFSLNNVEKRFKFRTINMPGM